MTSDEIETIEENEESPMLRQIRGQGGICGARARKETQRTVDTNPLKVAKFNAVWPPEESESEESESEESESEESESEESESEESEYGKSFLSEFGL